MHRLRSLRRLVSPPLRRSFATLEHLTPATLDQVIDETIQTTPIEKIRNFSIVAHIDHGKSTLADRLLEAKGNITAKEREEAQHLDNLQVERERGITVKAQSASMLHHDPKTKQSYILNLIDTPGHVDFSFEVSRSLSACEGALLLVDSAQGIQAQTIATFRAAKELGLTMIPVLTKIDMPNANPEEALLDLAVLLDVDPEDVILTSAKTGQGIAEIFPAVVDRLPPPKSTKDYMRCLLIDSFYDDYRGTICHIKVVDGTLKPSDKITCKVSGRQYDVQEVGVMLPHRKKVSQLNAGQVGYMIAGMKSATEAKVGDTLYHTGQEVEALPGFQEARSMVFAGIYPTDQSNFDDLRTAVNRLLLNDASVSVTQESSTALGLGLRCGFLGLLHMEVFHQRLADEQKMDVLVTNPMAPYTVILPNGEKVDVENPANFPVISRHHQVLEPMVEATIITPADTMGGLLELLKDRRGEQVDVQYIDDARVSLTYMLPWQEVVTDFYDELKSITSGYATLNYAEAESQFADIVKVDLLLNGKPLDALSFVCHRSKAYPMGKALCKRLIKVIDRQQYEISVQAALGVKVFAKERLAPYRKDVLIKSGKTVGGGDITRKKKLLAKQKEGKKRMKTVGNVPLSQEAFWSVIKR